MKKTLKWLIPVCVAAVLVLVAVVLLPFIVQRLTAADEPEQDFALYWNVEPSNYRTQKLMRYPNSEGLIYVTLSHNGEQVRYAIKDNVLLANEIDQLDVMCLEFDDTGYITDCHRVEELGGKIIANKYHVSSVEGNTVTCNSSGTGRGYDVVFELTEDVPVWDVTNEGITCGIAGSVHTDDLVTVVEAPDKTIHAVYTSAFKQPQDIYWNVDRKYDSVTKSSTREMDATGGYTISVAVNGELTTVKTRDYQIVQNMDAMAAKCFGLEFDENGLVSQVIHAGTAAGGGSCASWYRVDEYSDNILSATKTNTGATFSGMVSPNVVAYDVSGYGAYIGEPTTVNVGDTVHCLKDSRGRIAIIFVVRRKVESELYWNVERKWDSDDLVTTRRPAADGWYYVKVAVQGKQITVKTQNKELVQAIDARAARCFGLKLSGDVIEQVYTPDSVTGGATFASWYDVTAIDGKTITCYKPSTGDVRTGTMLDDCEIYNVSTNSSVVGEVTTLQIGDKIHSLKDSSGKICAIFVVNRYVNYPTYYNLTRKWDSKTHSTTRTPDADGYYVFQMAYEGQIVTVKTKSKAVANDIDSQSAKCVALSISNGIAYKAIHPQNTMAYKGGPTSSYTTVTSVSKYGFRTEKTSNGVVTKTYNETLSSSCKIYNVSGNVISHKGEPTTIQVGDYVHCLKNGSGKVALVYVLNRYEDLGVYYNLDRQWDDATQATTRTPDAEGHYVFRMAHKGQEVTVKTADPEVANAIDSQIARVVGLGFDTDGLATKAIHAQYTQECRGGIGVSYATVTAIEGNKVTTQKSGTSTTFTISDNPNVFDVSASYKVNPGEITTLRVGDHIHCLENKDGDAHYIYIVSRVAVIEPVDHSCQHVTEQVTWYEWDGASTPAGSGYYVLTRDAVLTEPITIEAGDEITICLNGHTVESDVRMFRIYGTLNLCDHKDGSGNYKGKLTSSYGDTVDSHGQVTEKAFGALAYLYNSSVSSALNIYGGIYEHTGNVTRGGLVYIANKQDVAENKATFCLYDGVLTGGSSTEYGGAVFVSNNGHFAMYGGTISGSKSASGGAVAMNTDNGTVLIAGGTITANSSTGNGGAIHMDHGRMTMTDGKIISNTATGSGGGVNVQGGTFEMTGGKLDSNTGKEGGNLRINRAGTVELTDNAVVCNGSATNGGNITTFGKLTVAGNAKITGGKATGLGSAISVFSNYNDAQVDVTVTGGTIEGTVRYTSNKGVSVSMYLLGGTVDTVNFMDSANATVEPQLFVGGTVKVQNINLAKGKQIRIYNDSLETTASIGVSAADVSAPFCVITDPNDAACFRAADDGLYQVVNKNNALYLEARAVSHTHCLCNGKASGLGDHVCQSQTEWTAWTDESALPTESGSYYLTVDVKLSAMFEMKGKLDLKLCLNGHTVTGPGGGKRAFLLRDADLHITDCQGSGVITNAATDSLNGGLIYQYSGSSSNQYNNSVNLYGGTLTITGKAKAGGVLLLGNNSSQNYHATFNMYGGTVIGGAVVNNGGAIQTTNKSVCNIYGGVVTGGNIYHTSGQLNLLGGKIGNVHTLTTTTVGGNTQVERLYLPAGKTLTVNTSKPLSGALIGISMETAGRFITLTDPAAASCFQSADSAYTVDNQEGVLSLVSTTG